MPGTSFAVVPHTGRAEKVCRNRRGFTLLELCIVLFIIAMLAGVAMPAMDSAFTEQGLRGDAHQFSLMVKTAMIKSSEQNRPYVIELEGKNISLRPVAGESDQAGAVSNPSSPGHSDRDADPAPALEDVTMDLTLANKFALPDARKKDAWETLPSISWTFEPAGLCPLPRVRISQGNAWIEMSFSALTGNVEDEALYIP